MRIVRIRAKIMTPLMTVQMTTTTVRKRVRRRNAKKNSSRISRSSRGKRMGSFSRSGRVRARYSTEGKKGGVPRKKPRTALYFEIS